MAARIMRGSQNVWGEAAMPAHSDLSEGAALEIAEWILRVGLDKTTNYLAGKEGAFRPTPANGADDGYLALKASYTDNGSPGNAAGALTGTDVVVIRLR